MIRLGIKGAAALGGLLLTLILSGAATRPFNRNQKAFYADPKLVGVRAARLDDQDHIGRDRPGRHDHVVLFPHGPARSASLGSHRSLRRPAHLGQLHRGLHPGGPDQYVDYVTRTQTGAVSGTVTQAAGENNGVFTASWRRHTSTRSPRTRRRVSTPAVTHTIGIYGSRNLTEFDLGTNYASATFNFVPNGSAVHA